MSDNPNKAIDNIEAYFRKFIPSKSQKVFSGNWGLERVHKILECFENPQNRYKSIHIAGTSGKSTQAKSVAELVKLQGFKVGLIISPFLKDFREMFQVLENGKGYLLEIGLLEKYFVEFKQTLERALKDDVFQDPTYFELVNCFGFFIFAKEKVDYAVIEVGLGGKYDCTNVIEREDKVCLFTQMGFDHTEVLGNTLDKIVKQKVGIVFSGNPVFYPSQEYLEAEKYIQTEAKKRQSSLIKKVRNDSRFPIKIAKEIIEFLAKREGFEIDYTKWDLPKLDFSLPARFQIIDLDKDKQIILDGAHNPQKIKFFINKLQQVYPNKKFKFLVSFLEGKDYKTMLDLILPLAEELVYTEFEFTGYGLANKSFSNHEIVKFIEEKSFSNFKVIPDSSKAYKYLRDTIIKTEQSIGIVTGSFYLLRDFV